MRNITHEQVSDNSLNAARAVNKMFRSAGNEKHVTCRAEFQERHKNRPRKKFIRVLIEINSLSCGGLYC